VAYGYALNVEVFGGLEIIPEQAEVVRNIYRLYVEERMSIRAIVRHLDDFGYSPSRKGTAWAKTTVNRILDNSTYAGYFYYNKFKRLDLKRIELRPRHEWIRIECQAIVDPEIYEKAQIIKDQNRVRSRKQVSRFYMLSGMVICSECERPYLSQTLLPSVTPAPEGRQHRKHESQCYRHRLRAGHCLNRQISAKLLENIVWEKALNILKDPDALIEGYNQSLEQQAITFQKKRNLIATLDQNLLKIRAKKQNLNAAYLDPDIEMSKQEFLEYKGKLEEETKIIEEDLAIKRREMDNVPLPADVEILKKFAAEIVRGIEPIEKLSRQKKREILQIMHVTALISPEGDVKLDGWFNVAEQQEKDGLSTSSSARYARQPQPLRERV
jgi:site-specific DNA recombinase